MVVQKIVISDIGAIKYYVVQNQDTQVIEKIDPLTAKLIIYEPIQRYSRAGDNIRSRRREKIKQFQERKRIAQIKSTKLLFTGNPNTRQNINKKVIRASKNNLRSMNFG